MDDPRHGIIPITLDDWESYTKYHPMTLFIDISLIADEATKKVIEDYCNDRGYIAGIDYIPEPGVACYVWHTLIQPLTGHHWQFPLARRISRRQPRLISTEQQLIPKIVYLLQSQGIAVETEVVCAAGKADIVTRQRDVIYEVKGYLSRLALFQAVGQVLLYRASINPSARAAIIGYPTSDTAVLKPIIESLGVRVIIWRTEMEQH